MDVEWEGGGVAVPSVVVDFDLDAGGGTGFFPDIVLERGTSGDGALFTVLVVAVAVVGAAVVVVVGGMLRISSVELLLVS